MTLRTDDGSTVTVLANRSFSKIARTYNLTVEGLHTYFVFAGDTPVLVHNSRCLIGSVIGPGGETLWLPKGRKAVAVTDKGKGWVYVIKKDEAVANGLSDKVAYVRVMDPVTSGPYQYPNGYVIYMNEIGQTMNPLTGEVGLPKNDPLQPHCDPMTSIEALFTTAENGTSADPIDWDPLREPDALQEVGLLDCRVCPLTGRAGLLLDMRSALQYRTGNAALLVVRGLRSFQWDEEPLERDLLPWWDSECTVLHSSTSSST